MIFKKNLEEHINLIQKLPEIESNINDAADIMYKALKNNGKLIFCGNGGSASDAQHISAEFIGRFVNERPPIHSIAISTDTSALTCISNDYGYENVFSRQIQGIGTPNDCFIGISTSGNSMNIINALKQANKMDISTIGILGRDGGKMLDFCDYNIIVPSSITARIQEMHILIGHTLVEIVEHKLNDAI